ncbi:MAG: CO dehydrogenase/acetyl-CoA synthase subunit delta [Candidatus Methanomethylicota archaeon]|uniref:CO dehydrogenase/acetyl-CoA synthase subunit delta n=1 Tax=Thermoproteota archaeon TaxID=2056631 RepID=A0A497EX86_9CREN|nr:MAG: CO dehydrogenase/acetyl-CoA synthase subunit delta [Candidatus Verstraetearchaeota archaeon]
MEERRKKALKDILNMISESEEIELTDVIIDADELTISFVPPQAPQMPGYFKLSLEPLTGAGKVEFLVEASPYGVRLLSIPTAPTPEKPKIVELIKVKFEFPTLPFTGKIAEVTIGATKSEGGTRSHTIKIGGSASMPFFLFAETPPNPMAASLDVFDMPAAPRPVKDVYGDAINDPAEWARVAVQKFGANLISFHLISTDPGIKDTPVSEAVKAVENVLQAVKVPLIIGGSGNPEKDTKLFTKLAEVTSGERVVFNSVTLDMDIEKTVKPIKEHGHDLIALAFIDINQAKDLCRKSMEAGLPKNRLILDPTTGALGYGIEYSFSIMERIRLSALLGEEVLQVPMCSASSNAWAAREARSKDPALGPRKIRGPLWEASTAIIALLAGTDLFMMLHPKAMHTVRMFAEALRKARKPLSEIRYENWVSSKF